MRYFISSLNSFVGTSIVGTLKNDKKSEDNPPFIVGSKCENTSNSIPDGVTRVIDVKINKN